MGNSNKSTKSCLQNDMRHVRMHKAGTGQSVGAAHMTDYRIVIADDHPLFRGALRQALVDAYENLTVEEAGNLNDTIALLGKNRTA